MGISRVLWTSAKWGTNYQGVIASLFTKIVLANALPRHQVIYILLSPIQSHIMLELDIYRF